ncbi:Protein disulfide-isomerase A5, partial [Eschrichtius robustus]|nr:Protein disulfide-isomerase A5 [Eschrichtius robustus]
MRSYENCRGTEIEPEEERRLSGSPESPPPPEPAWEEQQTSVVHLAGDNFRETLKRKKHALVMFYAPWCPHCKKVIPHFTAAADAFKDDRKSWRLKPL